MFPPKPYHAKPPRKSPGKTVIAHISDLHFTSQTNPDRDFVWRSLQSDLANKKDEIDLLAVTGDLIDAPFAGLFRKDEAEGAFTKVRSYLEDVCQDLAIEPSKSLIAVPGNHDCRLKGIIRQQAQSTKFYNKFKDCFRHVLLPTLGIYIFALDSNSLEKGINLATGLVDKNDLLDFSDLAKSLCKKNGDEWHSCTKIVLLHHHPMPIAATEGQGALDQPGFLLLKNAAQFMTNMVRSQIDLVLHGHQHCPAFSKVSFPTNNKHEHMITVIGAGSVGGNGSNFRKSYNLITITDSREIHLERRVLEDDTYQTAFKVPLRTYEDARQTAFKGATKKAETQIRARKYSRLYVIKSGSGDADIYEHLEGVTAYAGEVTEVPTEVRSESGFFYTPSYETPDGQRIEWQWTDRITDSPKRMARIVFDPALTTGRPITFKRQTKAFNLFHFNQRDRADATGTKTWSELPLELIGFTTPNVYDLLVLTVVFPKENFPEKFYREVHDNKCYGKDHNETCTRDLVEEKHFNLRFSKLKDAHTVVVSLEKPLPGCTYWVKWSLPKMEADELSLNPRTNGLADALARKLLELMNPDNPYKDKVQLWFEAMRRDFIASHMWDDLEGDKDGLEISLYSYDSNEQGLVCVAVSFPNQRTDDRLWEGKISPGKTLIGAAYRRKEPMIYSPLGSDAPDEAEYVNRIPEAWRRGKLMNEYKAVCCIPLYYPIPKGRRVAVLTFASKSDTSKLLNFIPPKQQLKPLEEAGESLVEHVMEHHFQKLAEALGVPQPKH